MWIETWQAAMRWLAQLLPALDHSLPDNLQSDVEALLKGIVNEAMVSLHASANRKKVRCVLAA